MTLSLSLLWVRNWKTEFVSGVLLKAFYSFGSFQNMFWARGSSLTNDCKGFRISQENVYDWVSLNKVIILQCPDCNFAIEITHYRYFFEDEPNTSCLKKTIFWEKSLRWTSFLIKLQPCSVLSIIKKRSSCNTFL